MGYFANTVSQAFTPATTGKPVKPEKVSLYDQRLQVPAGANQELVQMQNPWWQAASGAAAQAATALSQPEGPLYGQLEQQASDELALGGALDPDEVRQATQGARAAWDARGLSGSQPASFAEVLSRVQFADARKQQRQQFATGVATLGQQRQQGFGSLLTGIMGANNQAQTTAEGQRQFDLSRDDTLRYNDKNIAADLKIGKEKAEAGAQAGTTSAFGSILGGIVSHL